MYAVFNLSCRITNLRNQRNVTKKMAVEMITTTVVMVKNDTMMATEINK